MRELELAHLESAVRRFRRYATETPFKIMIEKSP